MRQILCGVLSVSLIGFLIVQAGMYLLCYDIQEPVCEICSESDCDGCSGS